MAHNKVSEVPPPAAEKPLHDLYPGLLKLEMGFQALDDLFRGAETQELVLNGPSIASLIAPHLDELKRLSSEADEASLAGWRGL